MSTPQPIDIAAACANAETRLRDYISRAAGQHRRAIARSFAELRPQPAPQKDAAQ